MIRALLSSLGFKGFYTLSAIIIAYLSPTLSSAQDVRPNSIPVLFDSRERLPKPDLSSLVRLRFLTSTDFPPFNFTDQAGKLAGFHVDLAREICADLDIADKCQIQSMAYNDLQPALANSQGDAILAGTGVTADLRKDFTFSRPYLMLPARFVRNTKVQIDGSSASALSGKRVGIVVNTRHAAMLSAFFPKLVPVPFDNAEALFAAVKDGSIDAAFGDGLLLSFWASSAASEKCCTLFDGPYVSQQFLGEGMTVMLRQQDTVLTAALNHALADLSRNGRLQEIYLRYFPNGLY